MAFSPYKYTHSSKPKVNVPRRPKYREKLADTIPLKQANIMFDQRIRRGITPSTKTATIKHLKYNKLKLQQQRYNNEYSKRKSVKNRRVSTPPPVNGRKHIKIQTMNSLEDFRIKTIYNTIHTQTDSALDYPSEPLFKPMLSGPCVSTQIASNDLFDFNMEVIPILDALLLKTINDATNEVIEEEELKEIKYHQMKYKKRDKLYQHMLKHEKKSNIYLMKYQIDKNKK